jgi:hypothetical protein
MRGVKEIFYKMATLHANLRYPWYYTQQIPSNLTQIFFVQYMYTQYMKCGNLKVILVCQERELYQYLSLSLSLFPSLKVIQCLKQVIQTSKTPVYKALWWRSKCPDTLADFDWDTLNKNITLFIKIFNQKMC